MAKKFSRTLGCALSSLIEAKVDASGPYAGIRVRHTPLTAGDMGGGRYSSYAAYSPTAVDLSVETFDTQQLSKNLAAGASAAALATAALPSAAHAQPCDAPAGGMINCVTGGGTIEGPISYTLDNYTITVEGAPTPTTVDGVGNAAAPGGAAGVILTGNTPTVTNNGIVVSGDTDDTNGGNTANHGIAAIVGPAEMGIARATNNGDITVDPGAAGEADVASHGVYAYGDAQAYATNTGSVTSYAVDSDGVRAVSSGVGASALNENGSVVMFGAGTALGNGLVTSHGVYSYAGGEGAALANNSEGSTIVTNGNNSQGLAAHASSDSLGAFATNSATSSITTYGENSDAIFTFANEVDATSINYGTIETGESGSRGVAAVAIEGGVATARNRSGGDIETAGANAYGVYAGANYGNAIATNAGDIDTTGQAAHGVTAVAGAGESNTAVATNQGAITTTGESSRGIFASATNAAYATNSESGVINSSSFGVSADSATAAYAQNSGYVGTTSSFAAGVFASGEDAEASNSAEGTISTIGNYAHGVFAQGSSSADADNDGDIDTTGVLAYGVFASTGTGDATASNGTGDIMTTGDGAHGVAANASGNGYVGASNGGTITTTGGGARGVTAANSVGNAYATNSESGVINSEAVGVFVYAGNGLAEATNSGSVTTTNNHGLYAIGLEAQATNQAEGSISTSSNFHYGAFASGSDDADATNAGSITTTGNYAHGVFARSYGEFDATAGNSGTIDVSGYGADGVRALGFDNSIAGAEATNASESNVYATRYGLYAYSEYDTATATNSGVVRITEAGNERRAGVFARTYGEATADANNNFGASIVMSGESFMAGVYADAYMATADASNAGSIDITLATESTYAAGVFAYAYNIDGVAIASNAATGAIELDATTEGGYAFGVLAYGSGENSIAEASNAGEITISGNGPVFPVGPPFIPGGVVALGYNATATNAEGGSITVTGGGAFSGVIAYGVVASAINHGDIDTTYALLGGLAANGADAADVINTGAVQVNYAYGAVFANSLFGAASVTNSGLIELGDAALDGAVRVSGYTASLDNQTGGSIVASGDGHFAVEMLGGAFGSPGSVSVTNAGSISATGMNSVGVYIDAYEGTATLNNTGSISGTYAAILSYDTDDTITHSGTITGDVFLAGGVDSFTVMGAAPVINSIIDGGGEAGDTFTSNPSGVFAFGGPGTHGIINFDLIDFAGGTSIFDNVHSSATNTVVEAGATFRAEGDDSSFSTDFANSGTVEVAGGTMLSIFEGGFAANAGSTTQFGAGDSGFGQLFADSNIAFAAGSTVAVDVESFSTLAEGQMWDAATSGGGAVTDASGAVTDNSALFNFSKSVVGGNILQITIEQALALPDIVDPDDPNASSAAFSLQGAFEDGGPDADAISTALGMLPTEDDIAAAIEDFVLDESNGAALSAINNFDRVIGLLNDRLNEGDLYDGDGPQGGLWAMGFGSWSDMDAQGFTTGFDADSLGGGLGFDFRASPNVLIGASYYYIDTDLDETGPNGAATGMTTHGLLAYIAGRAGGWRAKSSIGFGWSNFETARPIAILGETALAEFDGDQFTAHTELGYVIGGEGFSLTPVIGFRYVSLETGAYTETGSAGAAAVNRRSVESMRGEFGVILAGNTGGAGFAPEAHVRLLHEFLDPNELITGSYLAGGGPFTVIVNDRDDLMINAGGSISLISKSGIDLRLGYDGDFGDGFTSHAGSLTARLQF